MMPIVIFCAFVLLVAASVWGQPAQQVGQQPGQSQELIQVQTQLEMLKASRDFAERFSAQIITTQSDQLKQCQDSLAKLTPKSDAPSAPSTATPPRPEGKSK